MIVKNQYNIRSFKGKMSTKEKTKKQKNEKAAELNFTAAELKVLPINTALTYKKVCEILGIKYYNGGGNAKEHQLSELSRFFKYELIDRKIYIREIYKKPVPKKYNYPANTIYTSCIEKILAKYLSGREEDHGTTYISAQRLYLVLGIINMEYIEMQKIPNKQRLNDEIRENCGWCTESDEKDSAIMFYIHDFYLRTKSKFYSIIDSSLKSLHRQKLLNYSISYLLTFEEEIGDKKVIQTSHYTNDDESKLLLKAERKALLDMGYNTDFEIMSKKKDREYFEKVVEYAREDFPNLVSVYRYYKLLYDYENMVSALNNDELVCIKSELNKKVLNFINKQANNNYMKTLDIAYEEGFKYGVNYVSAQHYLSDRLIKTDIEVSSIDSEMKELRNLLNSIKEVK